MRRNQLAQMQKGSFSTMLEYLYLQDLFNLKASNKHFKMKIENVLKSFIKVEDNGNYYSYEQNPHADAKIFHLVMRLKNYRLVEYVNSFQIEKKNSKSSFLPCAFVQESILKRYGHLEKLKNFNLNSFLFSFWNDSVLILVFKNILVKFFPPSVTYFLIAEGKTKIFQVKNEETKLLAIYLNNATEKGYFIWLGFKFPIKDKELGWRKIPEYIMEKLCILDEDTTIDLNAYHVEEMYAWEHFDDGSNSTCFFIFN
jgi:hypothetical protein